MLTDVPEFGKTKETIHQLFGESLRPRVVGRVSSALWADCLFRHWAAVQGLCTGRRAMNAVFYL